MFAVGDKIVYPLHGAGIIEKIEEKKILGETKKYYILKLPCGDINIMVPVENSNAVGIRTVISEETIDEIMKLLAAPSSEMSGNWNRRHRENIEKLKTGNIFEVAEVVRNLTRVDREKKLSAGEKKLLTNARQILLSEIMLVSGKTKEEIGEAINGAI